MFGFCGSEPLRDQAPDRALNDGIEPLGNWGLFVAVDAPIDALQLTMVDRPNLMTLGDAKAEHYTESHDMKPGADSEGWLIRLNEVQRAKDVHNGKTTLFSCADGLAHTALRFESVGADGNVIDCAVMGQNSASYFTRQEGQFCQCLDPVNGCGRWEQDLGPDSLDLYEPVDILGQSLP
jgi:hypothetical protein